MNDFSILNRPASQAQNSFFGEAIVYRQKSSQSANDDGRLGRGNTNDVSISKAIRGRVTHGKAATSEGKLKTGDTSFRIHTDDLAFTPKVGDRILANDQTESFQVHWFEEKSSGTWTIYCRE